MKIKVSDLTNLQLDETIRKLTDYPWGAFHPSDRWDHGGPIMDAYEVDTYLMERGNDSGWIAEITGTKFKTRGRTRLIAAMRCFVVSKLGDEVEVPDELE